ncbi:pyruvate dehydrogenase (acetyl-transferring) E1 component subunit alpha, partial [Streptomyces sp. NPDC000594]
ERAAWEARDPIARLRVLLEREGLADDAFFSSLEEESGVLARRVREAVRSMPDPVDVSMFDHVYADGHALVDEERAEFLAYQASFADSEGGSGSEGAGGSGEGSEGGV